MSANARNPLQIGLTGGIASGKSLVADMFAELGVPIVDTDIVARDVVNPGTPALDEIRSAFGDGVINADGSLERKAMRDIVFADDVLRRKLEAILHPRIRTETEVRVAAIEADYLIIVVPLLAESPMKSMMDRILVVDCNEETQIERLMARDIESEEQARRIMATQASRTERLAIADDVIENNGSVENVRRQVNALHEFYVGQSAKSEA